MTGKGLTHLYIQMYLKHSCPAAKTAKGSEQN